MQLALGLSLQVVGCLFAALGLAFMKASSESDGDRMMLLRVKWWVGFLFLAILATALEGLVLTLVPLTIVAPFAGLTILLNMLIAATGLVSARVPLNAKDASGGALTIVGVGLASFYGPNDAASEASLTFGGVMRALSDPQFSVFIGCTLVSVVGWLYVVLAPSAHRARALAEKVNISTALSAYAAAVCGALSQTFLKSVSVALSYSLALRAEAAGGGGDGGDDGRAWLEPWLEPPMWMALIGLAVCAPLQLYLIDVTLASGAVTYAVPLYQALLVLLEIVAAAVFFRELETMSLSRLLGFAAGVILATAGLVVLSYANPAPGKSDGADPGARNGLSATLDAASRGNGDGGGARKKAAITALV